MAFEGQNDADERFDVASTACRSWKPRGYF
jgi:hypothetical protein